MEPERTTKRCTLRKAMKFVLRQVGIYALIALSAVGFSQQENPEKGAHLPSQAAADVLRDFAGADMAFIAAGLVKQLGYRPDDLSTLIQYPTDEVVIVELTGAAIRSALERSVSLFPQGSASFLQISGLEVTFRRGAAPDSRIVSVLFNSKALDESKTYKVAMPSSLGRGGLGYFKIWNKTKIAKTFTETVEDVLKGKKYVETAARWTAAG